MQKIFLALLVIPCILSAQTGIQFHPTQKWNEILSKAKKENKMIFLDAYTTWCGPCKAMSQNTFTDASVGEFYNSNFINAKIDMEAGDGLQIARKYAVNAYPTLLFIDANGEEIHMGLGYKDPIQFLNLGKDAMNTDKQMRTMLMKYGMGMRSESLLHNLASFSIDINDPDAEKYTQEYLNTQQEWKTAKTVSLLFKITSSTDSKHFNWLNNNQSSIENLANALSYSPKKELDLIIVQSAYKKYFQSLPKVDSAQQFMRKYRDQNWTKMNLAYMQMVYHLNEENFVLYMKYATEYLDNGGIQIATANDLNSIAWNFFLKNNNKAQLEKALDWAILSFKREASWYTADTIANLYNKLGNKTQAKEYAQLAISIGKKAGEDVSETEKLLQSL